MSEINKELWEKAKEIADKVSKAITVPEDDKYTPILDSQSRFIAYLLLKKEKEDLKTLEIGLGWGKSSSAFLAGGSSHHTAIEISKEERSISGEKNARKFETANNKLNIMWESSDIALPKILEKEEIFDMIFIDGGHRFGEVFVDFYYTQKLIKAGGHILLDDVWMPSVQALCSWIDNDLRGVFTETRPPTGVENTRAYKRLDTEDNRHWSHFEPFQAEFSDRRYVED